MSHRLTAGGRLIDRTRPVRFVYDGTEVAGFEGDTIASALLGAGVTTLTRSLYLGRPRGPLSAGREEPSALVGVTCDGVHEPLLRATDTPIRDGLDVESRSGRGRLVSDPGTPPRHDHMHLHCDVAIVGGGAAGLAAATAASGGGARVVLVDDGPSLGGSLLDEEETVHIDDTPAPTWPTAIAERLAAHAEVRVLSPATALGLYDGTYLVVACGMTLWHIRARRTVIAAGATERPLLFAGNDLPGVMLAGATRRYLRRYGVAPGRRALVAATNDSAYGAAAALAHAGVDVAAIVDARPAGAGLDAVRRVEGLQVVTGHVVATAHGADHVEAVDVVGIAEAPGRRERIDVDVVAVSGGWDPSTELGGAAVELHWSHDAAAFVPRVARSSPVALIGAAAGAATAAQALSDGWEAGLAAAAAVGFPAADDRGPTTRTSRAPARPVARWSIAGADEERQFIDLQRDVTVADIRRAVQSGLRSPEHVKRHTTLGTGSDQGRTAGALAIGVIADLTGTELGALRPTTARPPASPVSFALLAGRDRGVLADPERTTPMHEWHVTAGAVFEDVGQWKRPRYYPHAREGLHEAVLRECRAVRASVGAMDVSTLGKIDVHGPDAATFLDRMYTGDLTRLATGTARYCLLCSVDGMVFDDGVTMRLAEDRYLVTTTTGNAAAVLDWFEEWLQTEWPDLRVHCTSVTEQWATVAVAGPRSREVVAALAPDLAVDDDAFGFMAIREARVAGLAARVGRVSFSGELAFEISVAAYDGRVLWDAVMDAGATPYGTEAMHVLRAEKGYVIVGQDTDGTVTPQDLGYAWAISQRKGDFVGRRSHRRAALERDDRLQLVALVPDDGATLVAEGAQVTSEACEPGRTVSIGHVTSSYHSAALERPFALALVAGGRARFGETVCVTHGDGSVPATVAAPCLYDPEGRRRDG